MFQNIRHPYDLQDVPSVLLRSMPSVYYFSKLYTDIAPKKTMELFRSNVIFLANAVEHLSEKMESKELHHIAKGICNLKQIQQKHLFEETEKLFYRLIKFSRLHGSDLKNLVIAEKKYLLGMYIQSVSNLNILLVDNDHNEELIKKINKILSSFCSYTVFVSSSVIEACSDNLQNCDFVVLTSTHPQSVFEEVQFLQAYCIPGLAFASIEGTSHLDKQAIRNAFQLMDSDFKVLFKVITPIRFYASIDKIYMKYYLNSVHFGISKDEQKLAEFA